MSQGQKQPPVLLMISCFPVFIFPAVFPQTHFSFIPWICKKLQETFRKIQTVLEIVPVRNGRQSWTLQFFFFLTQVGTWNVLRKVETSFQMAVTFVQKGLGMAWSIIACSLCWNSQLITTWEMQQEKEPMSHVLRGRLLCLSLNTCWPGAAWHRQHQAHVHF